MDQSRFWRPAKHEPECEEEVTVDKILNLIVKHNPELLEEYSREQLKVRLEIWLDRMHSAAGVRK